MKIYQCDECGDIFEHPIAEVQIKVGNNTESVDLCSTCLNKIEDGIKDFKKNRYKKILDKKPVSLEGIKKGTSK